MSFKVKIVSRTWTKDNYNLFDYDLEKDINFKELIIKREGIITRNHDDIFYFPSKPKKGEKS